MKIVSIFAPKLYSFRFPSEELNELHRLLDNWNDVTYIYNFLKENKSDIDKNKNILELADQISDDAYEIENTLSKLSNSSSQSLEQFFKPLNNEEYYFQLLSRQKGRVNYLRIYALKIDENCFVITGGAIKLTQRMQDREHTQKELYKINQCKQFLTENGVHDSDSFYEFITEQQ